MYIRRKRTLLEGLFGGSAQYLAFMYKLGNAGRRLAEAGMSRADRGLKPNESTKQQL